MLGGGESMAVAFGVNTGGMPEGNFHLLRRVGVHRGLSLGASATCGESEPFGLRHGIEFRLVAVMSGTSHVWGAIRRAAIFSIQQDYLQTLLLELSDESGNF